MATSLKAEPVYSDKEIQALLAHRVPFEAGSSKIQGVDFPTVNGKAINGIDINLVGSPTEMSTYYGAVCHALGLNLVMVGYRDVEKESDIRVTPKHIAEVTAILKNHGIGFGVRNFTEVYATKLWPQLGLDKELLSRHRRGLRGHTWGNILSDDFVKAQTAIYDAELKFLKQQGNFFFFNPIDEFNNPIVPDTEGPEERKKFQAFAAQAFQDQSPAIDSNGDGTSYNARFGTQYATWEEVIPPAVGNEGYRHHYRGISREMARFHSLFAAKTWSAYIEDLSKLVRSHGEHLTYQYAQTAGENISTLAAVDGPTIVDPSTYDHHFNFCYYAGASWLFDKPSLANWVNVHNGNYAQTRFLAVRALPYTFRMIWWHLTPGVPADQKDDWGQNYNLGDQWEFDGTSRQWPKPLNRVMKMDPRMKAIAEAGPFIGKFSAISRVRERGILWISPERSLPVDDYWIGEEALAMHPDRVPWDRIRQVIYSPKSSCVDRTIFDTLEKFVISGGTVIVDAASAASGPDYLGRDNSRWLFGGSIRTVDDLITSDKFSYSDQFNTVYQWHADKKNASRDVKWPGIEETRGYLFMLPGKADKGSFEYHFTIPKEIVGLLVEDTHVAWSEGSRIGLEFKWQDEEWKPIYDYSTPYKPENLKEIITFSEKPGNRQLRLRYTMFNNRPSHSNRNDTREVFFQNFRLAGLEADQLQAARRTLNPTRMALTLGGSTLGYNHRHGVLVPPENGQWSNSRGFIINDQGERFPGFSDIRQGTGRWVIAHSPGLFSSREDLASRRSILSKIVSEGGVPLLNPAEPYVLQSVDGGAVLASRDGTADAAYSEMEIEATCALKTPVVMEVFSKTVVPSVRINKDRIRWTADMSEEISNRVWVIKDAEAPVMLCADGSEKYGLRVDDGVYQGRVLKMTFAQQAYISAPEAPSRVTASSGEVKYTYDRVSHVLHITGPGELATVNVEFPGPGDDSAEIGER